MLQAKRVAIVYNAPVSSRYDGAGEEKAVLGVLDSVEAVHRSLVELGYNVARVPLLPPSEHALTVLLSLEADLVFNLFEGFCGLPETEALVPDVLDELGMPYTGNPGSVLRLALDKARVKACLKAAGIRTPDFQLLTPETLPAFRLRYPCIVKPRAEDASHGVLPESLVDNTTGLERQVRRVCGLYGGEALVEEFASGREFNATVMGNNTCRVLPPSEIVYTLPAGMPRILTFASKWEQDSIYYQHTQAVCPAQVSPDGLERISGVARAAFRLVGCHGYGRVDMRLDEDGDEDGEVNVIEVNPNPDISPGVGAIRQAAAAGMDYTRFVAEIIHLARQGDDSGDQDSSHDIGRQSQHHVYTA